MHRSQPSLQSFHGWTWEEKNQWKINSPAVPNDGYDNIQRQAMIAAQNAEYDLNEILDVEDEEVVEEQDDMTLGTMEPK